MTPITDVELAAWREAREEATADKWVVGPRWAPPNSGYTIESGEAYVADVYAGHHPSDVVDAPMGLNNATFITLAANEWTRLLDALVEARAALEDAL